MANVPSTTTTTLIPATTTTLPSGASTASPGQINEVKIPSILVSDAEIAAWKKLHDRYQELLKKVPPIANLDKPLPQVFGERVYHERIRSMIKDGLIILDFEIDPKQLPEPTSFVPGASYTFFVGDESRSIMVPAETVASAYQNYRYAQKVISSAKPADVEAARAKIYANPYPKIPYGFVEEGTTDKGVIDRTMLELAVSTERLYLSAIYHEEVHFAEHATEFLADASATAEQKRRAEAAAEMFRPEADLGKNEFAKLKALPETAILARHLFILSRMASSEIRAYTYSTTQDSTLREALWGSLEFNFSFSGEHYQDALREGDPLAKRLFERREALCLDPVQTLEKVIAWSIAWGELLPEEQQALTGELPKKATMLNLRDHAISKA